MDVLRVLRSGALLAALVGPAACHLDALFGTPGGGARVAPGNGAVRLLFTVQPSRTMADSVIRPAAQVTAYDSLGNVVTSLQGTISVALGNDGSALKNAKLSGSRASAATNGVATFGDLSINQLGNGYTITAAFGGATPVTESAPFDITAVPPPAPGPATHLGFTAQPQQTRAGTAIAPVQVTALDSLEQPASSFTGPITVALGANPRGGTLSGTKTVNAVNGVATFADLSIGTAATGYTLTAGATGPSGATSTPFDIVPGPATVLAFTVQPHDAAPLLTIQPPVQVTALDALGNRATDFTGVVRVAIGRDASLLKNAVLSGTRSVSAAGGVATFSDLSIDQPGLGYTLAAAFATGAPVTESNPFNVVVP